MSALGANMTDACRFPDVGMMRAASGYGGLCRNLKSGLLVIQSLLTVLVIGMSGCSQYRCDYNFSAPDTVCMLPGELLEISGLSHVSNSVLACIQDEQGVLYMYDAKTRQIIRSVRFADDGDYEGLARAGNTMFVLRSDGNLFEIADFASQVPQVRFHVTGVPAAEYEGLCYDAPNERLMIAAKGKSGDAPEDKGRRMVYGIDLGTRSLQPYPVFALHIDEIEQSAATFGIEIPAKLNRKHSKVERDLKMRPSAICRHPVTGYFYMLSAVDHLLFVFNSGGHIAHVEQLPPELFAKAEGISFDDEGVLFISNEGNSDTQATILKFIPVRQ